VLVTGPERLGVYGEILLRLDPLALPSPERSEDLPTMQQIPSVLLFVQRTRMVRPNFALTNENLDAVAKLCIRTDGIPLAIELAAARMKLLSPQRLLAELDKDLDSLSGTEFDTLSRHRGMRQAIERSLGGLKREERAFLARLAMFGKEFDAAAAVGMSTIDAGGTQQLLERLVDKNLLRTTECPDGDLIITMLGLTRQYLLERLGEQEDSKGIRSDHARYFLSMTRSAEAALRGPEQTRWLQQMDHWHLDITTALRYFEEVGDGASLIAMTTALRLYWQARGSARDGIRWLHQGLESAGTGGTDPDVTAGAERVMAELLLCTGELRSAEDWLGRARTRYEELDDSAGIASCLRISGQVAFHRGDLAEAERRFEECVSLCPPEDDAGRGEALRDLAECHRSSGDLQTAKAVAEEALAVFRPTRDTRNIALTNIVRADVAFAAGDQDTAIELYQTAMLQIAELGHLLACAMALEKFAIVLTRSRSRPTETWRRAAKAFGTAAAIRATTGFTAPVSRKMEVESVTANTRVRLGDQEAEELAAVGAGMEPDVAITAVLTPLECAGIAADWEGPGHPLTPRELEVAVLVASGLTNREIARRLGIAEWTAVNHLRKIMRKLACSSRVQVASWMAKRAEDGVEIGAE
jgi:predicted ATPase/DNA-binding CsgD family transcriptional regulator